MRVRLGAFMRVAAIACLAIASDACEDEPSRSTTKQDNCLLFCDECTSDNGCPPTQICISGLFAAYCETPRQNVCSSSADCASYEECRIRDEYCFLCSYPGRTRRTCERKTCRDDESCGIGNECVDQLFGSPQCYPESERVPPDAGADAAADSADDGDPSDAPDAVGD